MERLRPLPHPPPAWPPPAFPARPSRRLRQSYGSPGPERGDLAPSRSGEQTLLRLRARLAASLPGSGRPIDRGTPGGSTHGRFSSERLLQAAPPHFAEACPAPPRGSSLRRPRPTPSLAPSSFPSPSRTPSAPAPGRARRSTAPLTSQAPPTPADPSRKLPPGLPSVGCSPSDLLTRTTYPQSLAGHTMPSPPHGSHLQNQRHEDNAGICHSLE
ncbi:uncharacterized protein LOC142843581 [Microtus pennsylvanicus]|uniref:uncharacterized protein LOC142843581 n=1 Tax=Microtus pennsylvanicus TaxID=10058 RepID=UPI003F6D7A43